MTEALRQVFHLAQRLPDDEQIRLAERLLDAVDERRWIATFSQSPDLLATLSEEAMAEERAGNTRPMAEAPSGTPDPVNTDPGVMAGKPVIAGTRITVESILARLGAGEPAETIVDAHPQLTLDNVQEALRFAARAARFRAGPDVERLEAMGLALPRVERARLARTLSASLEEEERIEQAWREETHRRVRAVEDGTATTIPIEEALAKARELLRDQD